MVGGAAPSREARPIARCAGRDALAPTRRGGAQLVDFGFAKVLRHASHMKTQCGSPWSVRAAAAPRRPRGTAGRGLARTHCCGRARRPAQAARLRPDVSHAAVFAAAD